MACLIDSHVRAKEIATWLQEGVPSSEINQRLSAEGFDPLAGSSLSVHKLSCLGLERSPRGRKVIEPVEMPEETPPIADIRDLALKVFYHRLRTNPNTVATRELVPILTQILRAEAAMAKSDPLSEAMEALLANSTGGEGPPSE